MSCRLKEIADASMQAAESHCTVDVTPPQAATKIMAGMAEQQTEWMADGMVE